MTGPVAEFMKRGSIVVGRCVERGLRWKVDRIDIAVVIGAVVLIVTDPRAGMLQDAFTRLNDLELFSPLWFVRGNSFNLLGIKNRIDPVNHSAGVLRISRAVIRCGLRAVSGWPGR